jgi:K+-transporting ATPase c subunit
MNNTNDKNQNQNNINNIRTTAPARRARHGAAALACATALVLASGCSLRQSYPETQITGYINGQPFSINAPKDVTLTGFDAIAGTNGEVHVHIDSLKSQMNPTNLASAAEGQAAIVTATGQVINQAINQAAAAAAIAAKTAITN